MNKRNFLAAGILFLAAACGAQAGTLPDKNAEIGAKSLSFVSGGVPAGAKVVVVGNATSLATVQGALKGATVVEGSVEDAKGAFAAFVPDVATAKAIGGKTVTVGDVACVQAKACVLAVDTDGKVTILVSKDAAAAAGTSFGTNFKMMITEL